jgi:hypothetical protein
METDIIMKIVISLEQIFVVLIIPEFLISPVRGIRFKAGQRPAYAGKEA